MAEIRAFVVELEGVEVDEAEETAANLLAVLLMEDLTLVKPFFNEVDISIVCSFVEDLEIVRMVR